MYNSFIKKFLRHYPIVQFREEDIEPLLVDFLENICNSKRKISKAGNPPILILTSLDKPLIKQILNAYNLSISFGTNELSENIEDKDALIEILSKFATFCITHRVYENKNSKKNIHSPNYECYA